MSEKIEVTKTHESFVLQHKGYSIAVEVTFSSGKLDIKPMTGRDEKFWFKNSKPEVIEAVGRMIATAARLGYGLPEPVKEVTRC